MKMCNVHVSFTFFRIWTAAYLNVPKGSRERVTFTFVQDLDLVISSAVDKCHLAIPLSSSRSFKVKLCS